MRPESHALGLRIGTAARGALDDAPAFEPLRRISVRESVKAPGWASLITLLSDTAYHSFIGEVEALNTTTIRRLTRSRRHQLLAIPRPVRRRVFQPIAERKLRRRQLTEDGNVEISGRDLQAALKPALRLWPRNGVPGRQRPFPLPTDSQTSP